MTKKPKKALSKTLWVIFCVVLFIAVFAGSALIKFNSIMGLGGNYTLQGAYVDQPLTEDEMTKEVIDIRYIAADDHIDTRPIMLYKPKDASGDLPLVFIPHYAAEENAEDFVSWIKHGWAVAAATDFKAKEYNALLVTDDLVFNNAALYTLRNMEGIDQQKIAIVGGSAGGYMTMMLTQLQMGTTASIANSPITNIYFNFHIHFPACDEVNKNSGIFEFKMPYQGMVSKYFRPINDILGDDYSRWEAVSPISMARAISSPTVINHFTSDLLVPIDQTTKTYSYDENDGSLPEDFTACLGEDYPGILSMSLEELANPDELFIRKYELQNQSVDMEMPYSDRLLTINVYDDGRVGATSSHMATNVTGTYKIMPYLEEMMTRTLMETEKLIPEKVMLLLDRYEGNSLALPPHTGIDDTVYGSLAIYQEEIVDEFAVYMNNHSLEELDEAIIQSIETLSSNDTEKQMYLDTWMEIKSRLS